MKLRLLLISALCSIFFNAVLAALSSYSKAPSQVFEFACLMVSETIKIIETGANHGRRPVVVCFEKYNSSQGLATFFCDEQTIC